MEAVGGALEGIPQWNLFLDAETRIPDDVATGEDLPQDRLAVAVGADEAIGRREALPDQLTRRARGTPR